jgi:aryl-alcohol dehydrogenase-like predicted oxidoreductase
MTKLGGSFNIGNKLRVSRIGYGAMQLPGPGVWGPSPDPDNAKAVLRAALELGIDFIDTADSYGPDVADELIHDALWPYPEQLTIATKTGLLRTGPGEWHPLARPEYIRQQCEMSLRKLGVEQIQLFQLHRIDPLVPLEDQVGTFKELQQQGKIAHIGLSEVSVDEIKKASQVAKIDTVQNLYNLGNRQSEEVLNYCQENQIGFIPWFPIQTGQLASGEGILGKIASDLGATPAQVAIAWLLHKSPVMLPIPGTKSIAHLKENVEAADIELSQEQMKLLDSVAK